MTRIRKQWTRRTCQGKKTANGKSLSWESGQQTARSVRHSKRRMVHNQTRGDVRLQGPLRNQGGPESLCFRCGYFSGVSESHGMVISYLYSIFTVWISIINVISFLTFKKLRLKSRLRPLNFQGIPLDDLMLCANLNISWYYVNNKAIGQSSFLYQASGESKTFENLINNSSFWNSMIIWYLRIFSACYFTF